MLILRLLEWLQCQIGKPERPPPHMVKVPKVISRHDRLEVLPRLNVLVGDLDDVAIGGNCAVADGLLS